MKYYLLGCAFALLLNGCGTEGASFDLDKIELNNRDKLGKVEATTDNEMLERKKILNKVDAAIKASDFATLNEMAEEYRSHRALTPSGTWKLGRIYQELTYNFANKETFKGCANPEGKNFVARWLKFSPQEPAVHILTARINRRIAWCFRGGAYAQDVPPEQMAKFDKIMSETYDALYDSRNITSQDPEYYIEMSHIYPNIGASKSDYLELMADAINSEPYYYDFYFAARPYFEEKWLGDPGDLQRFDDYVTKATAAGAGQGVYARIFWVEMKGKYLSGDPAFRKAADWDKWKAGMRDVARQYPDDWNLSNFAEFSCNAEDYSEVAYYFKRIKKHVLAAWNSGAEFEGCKNEAGFSGEVDVDRKNW